MPRIAAIYAQRLKHFLKNNRYKWRLAKRFDKVILNLVQQIQSSTSVDYTKDHLKRRRLHQQRLKEHSLANRREVYFCTSTLIVRGKQSVPLGTSFAVDHRHRRGGSKKLEFSTRASRDDVARGTRWVRDQALVMYEHRTNQTLDNTGIEVCRRANK